MDNIKNRIVELERMKEEMELASSERRKELASIEAEATEIKNIIHKNIFENTAEYGELKELRITQRWLDIYSNEIAEEEEETTEEE